MTTQPPSIARNVHYTSHGTPVRPDGSQAFGSECRAAIITRVNAECNEHVGCIGLCVISPNGLFLNEHVPYGEKGDGGSWHWPEWV